MEQDCIIWQGYIHRTGYGQRNFRGKPGCKAHRVAYELAYGPIPEGMTVDHLCFVKACVNPAHLRLLTLLENQRNQRSAYKTHCVNGHEYTPENTYRRPRGRTVRHCRACNVEAVRRYQAKKRATS